MASKNYIQLHFNTATVEQNDILIALLANAGFEGFEETNNDLHAFIAADCFNKDEVGTIANNLNITYTTSIVEHQNWNEQWEGSFEPVIINDFAAVRASFHAPVKNIQHEIIITPKMSFGTGHHATTWLMIAQMSRLNFKDKTVFDFGTGTGVLAILAKKMGAKNVVAVDNDDWSIENAKENILQNNVTDVELQKADAIITDRLYDIVLANINRNIIINNIKAAAAICGKDAFLLFSGFLLDDLLVIQEAIKYNGLIFNSFSQQKDWICIQAFKPG
jgi:ribosomal protein L11 methyltransferase